MLKEDDVTEEKIRGYLSGFGRKFYGIEEGGRGEGGGGEKIVLRKKGAVIEELFASKDGSVEVVPFRRKQNTWSVDWI